MTTDRYDSCSPAWSPDGHWLYFLSDRNFKTTVEDPWGTYQPEPFLDKKTKIFQIALTEGLRSPWLPKDEAPSDDKAAGAADDVKIELKGIRKRLYEVPIPAGNYTSLAVGDKVLFWLSTPAGDKKASLKGADVTTGDVEVKDMTDDVKSFELSRNGEKLLVQKDDGLYVIDASASSSVELAKKDVPLDDWTLTVHPREEWKQMFAEAWRLERDYFYDPHLHGVDWQEVRKKYEPLAERVASRAELADLIGQMVSELSALHIFVRGGDVRKGGQDFPPSFLGAELTRDEKAGGYRVGHVYETDPDEPEWAGPLARPHVHVKEGDVIESVNGTATLSVADIGVLLRRQADKQVLLHVKPADGGDGRDVVVKPIDETDAADLRYHDWEYSRRKIVDDLGKEQIGYVHLRAMESDDFAAWAREYYPVFTRQGLIIDVRNNEGGNIDSWILDRLTAQGVVLLEQPGRPGADVGHAVRLPRPYRRLVQREHGVGRRGVHGGDQAAGHRQGDRHADVGRRDLAQWRRLSGGQGHCDGGGVRRVRPRGQVADREPRRRSRCGGGRPAARHVPGRGRPAESGHCVSAKGDQGASGRGAAATAVPEQGVSGEEGGGEIGGGRAPRDTIAGVKGEAAMTRTVEAVYDGAVLRPETALGLEPNTRVRLTVEVLPAAVTAPASFLHTARSLELQGPADWSANLDHYLYGDGDQPRG